MAKFIITDFHGPCKDEGPAFIYSNGAKKEDKMHNYPHRFRMYDDDDILYYQGQCTEEAFDPLDDFGMVNAGCTRIDYENDNGVFETL